MTRLSRWLAGTMMAVAVFVLPGFSLADVPPPAEQGSFPIPNADDNVGVWTTPAIELTTTAVGVSWQAGEDPGGVWVRSSDDGDDWGPWSEIETEVADHRPDSSSAEGRGVRPTSEPVYIGEAAYVQFRGTGEKPLRAEWVETGGRKMSIKEKVDHFFDRLQWGSAEPAAAQPETPAMVTRSAWGGDACIGDDPHELDYADRVQILFVHHTNHGGNENGYAAAETKDLVYAICTYHVNVREFWDIGYNFLVDKFGNIYEGRRGGIEATVMGAHTGGFNSYSTGVGFIGDHQFGAPTPAAQEAFQRLAAWKLDVHHLDPNATVTVESFGSTLYDEGEMVTFRTISGHRDAASTACPGNACYSLIDPFRTAVAPIGGPKIYGGWPATDPIPGLPTTGYTPTAFPLQFTEEMSWTFTINDIVGAELARFEGVGREALPVWDGTFNGAVQPVGDYRAVVTAVPVSGAAPPRPALFEFQLGSYYPPFSDDDDSIHVVDIDFIYDVGITAGCGGDRYCPRKGVERWEMAIFLTRAWESLGLAFPDYQAAGFEDVGHLLPVARESIDRLVQLGISSGTSPTTFDPNAVVTRWQMALFLSQFWNQAGIFDPPGTSEGDRFLDVQQLPEHVQAAIGQIATLGITSGTSPTTYDPFGSVSREQMATFLARTLQGLGWTPEES